MSNCNFIAYVGFSFRRKRSTEKGKHNLKRNCFQISFQFPTFNHLYQANANSKKIVLSVTDKMHRPIFNFKRIKNSMIDRQYEKSLNPQLPTCSSNTNEVPELTWDR